MTIPAFAAFAQEQRSAPLDATLRHAAARATVDWFGATVAGSVMEPARILHKTVAGAEGEGPCELLPAGQRVGARSAALVNGAVSHIAEMDDIFRAGVYHPGSPTVAAAFALAQQAGVAGADMLRAVAVGYEIGDRIAATVQPAHYRYWHTTGTVGTIGAAAAAAEILQLDADRFAHALATATTMAAGLQQAFRSDAMSKPLHAGHAADAGVLAATLAAGGYTGALDILEGDAGFGAGLSDSPDWQDAVRDLGSAPWGITQATVKNHSCCGHTFAAVDAALALRKQGLRPEEIVAIEVATYGTAVKVAGICDPQSAFEAKFSTAYCMAAAFLLGSVRLQAFEDRQLRDPAMRELLSKVTLDVDPEFDAQFPGKRAARVTVRDRDGRTHEYVRHTRKGDPDDPLSDEELDEKFADLATPVLGVDGVERLREALWGLADCPDVRGLVAAIRPGA